MESAQQSCFFEYQIISGYPYRFPVLYRRRYQQVWYLRYLPETYLDKDSWPLVLFLHGSGERGHDLEMLKREGLPKLIDEGAEFPFIIIAPQCPPHCRWDVEMLGKLLDQIERDYRVDRDRIYVTGTSMGGGGTWRLGVRFPQRFAALVPICGRSSPKYAAAIKHLPIWVFHGAKDSVVPARQSITMVAALQARGSNVRFTLYPEGEHDCWNDAYADPQLYDWLLTMRRGMSTSIDATEMDETSVTRSSISEPV